MSLEKHITLDENDPHQIQLKEMCNKLKSNLQRMKTMSELDDDYCDILSSSFHIEHQMKSIIRRIANSLR